MNPAAAITLDLTAILDLAAQLPARAIETQAAVIALAPVANQEAWAHRQDTLGEQLEAHWWRQGWCDWPPPETVRSSTPLQILCVWTEWVRVFYDLEREQPPLQRTLTSEVAVLRWKLDAILNDLTEDQAKTFARDIGSCRRRLEDVVLDGLRDEISHDVTCLADGCQDVFLVRRMLDEGRGKRARKGLADEWSCPRCDRRYDGPAYNLALAEAARHSAESLVSEAARHAMRLAEGVA